jgi:uncharacterized protein (TIGR03032 family)
MNDQAHAAAYSDRVLQQSSADSGFVALLRDLNVSLVAAIRPGALVAFGAVGDALSISCTPIPQPMGIAWDGKLLAVGGKRDITVFAPSTRLAAHLPGKEGRHDVVFVPIAMYRTGECMVHEMAIDGPSVVFTNTLFSCLARAEGTQSFTPLWRPSFISQLMPEDRCHLNSFATEGKRIRYATAFSASDTRQGFRELPINSGIVIDVEKNAVVASGLTRPHSVRLFDDKLYVLDSGLGAVLLIDPEAQKSETVAMLPGFTRGLRRHGKVLFVGLSTLRVSAMPLHLPLEAREETLFAGIAALDLETGQLLGTLRLAPDVEELFDFVVMPGINRALVFDPVLDAPLTAIETPDSSFLMAAQVSQQLPTPPGDGA